MFEQLWTDDPNLVVSTGRGASANADWAANKTIALPDWRGRALAALDDMGNSAAGRLTATYFGTAATVLGAASTGLESRTLVTGNLPPYTPAGTNSSGQFIEQISSFTMNVTDGTNVIVPSAGETSQGHNLSTQPTFAGTAQGGVSTPLSIVQPTMLATVYLKL